MDTAAGGHGRERRPDRFSSGLRAKAKKSYAGYRTPPARAAQYGYLTSISPLSENGSTRSIWSPLQNLPGSYQLAGRCLGSSPMC